ncbi:37S ribosomal protein MRP17, mitochondrial [Candida viswanathii]|uniref:Small ribosomal subunit protein bS6m n=1 Tax=Candida viswanathii TaxID=5486 RepID=A0A367YJV2_9ASCO|nr:37S ribosomal protein MRP17, mitochondrial [Candida viswanathii]
MYYELFAIARITDPLNHAKEAKKIASTVGKLILNNRGLVRSITSLGARPLPKIISKDQERHFQGYQFLMGFDCSVNVQEQLLRTLKKDPRILRSGILKHDLTQNLDPGTSIEQAVKAAKQRA